VPSLAIDVPRTAKHQARTGEGRSELRTNHIRQLESRAKAATLSLPLRNITWFFSSQARSQADLELKICTTTYLRYQRECSSRWPWISHDATILSLARCYLTLAIAPSAIDPHTRSGRWDQVGKTNRWNLTKPTEPSRAWAWQPPCKWKGTGRALRCLSLATTPQKNSRTRQSSDQWPSDLWARRMQGAWVRNVEGSRKRRQSRWMDGGNHKVPNRDENLPIVLTIIIIRSIA
jgi:hypothetical protein